MKNNKSVAELANNIDDSAYVKDITVESLVDITKKYFRKSVSRKE